MSSLLWAIVVLLVVVWLIGLVGHLVGDVIHVVLIAAVVLIVYNLISKRRRT
jgi:hypothetical protein